MDLNDFNVQTPEKDVTEEKKNKLYEEYKLLSQEEKNEIENIVCQEYIKQCGVFEIFKKGISICKREFDKRIFIQEKCGK